MLIIGVATDQQDLHLQTFRIFDTNASVIYLHVVSH